MKNEKKQIGAFAALKKSIQSELDQRGVALLEPIDVQDSLRLMKALSIPSEVAMLDPWYNKGVGGEREDYFEYITSILEQLSGVSKHVFLWGFPEIVANFLAILPAELSLVAWLTWYYKNNPSVIRGWRSSQMACLHLSRKDAPLYPQHFLNDAQLSLQERGKLRYMPGPTSVIEEPLLVGFVGRSQQTGHPSQKPEKVYERMFMMTTKSNDLIIDPMCGSGTSAAASLALGRKALLSDHSEEYTCMVEERIGVRRIIIPEIVRDELHIEYPRQDLVKVHTNKKPKTKTLGKSAVREKDSEPSLTFPQELLD